MIVCRRPCTLYDVDVIALVALAAMALAAYFGVILPGGATTAQYRDLSAGIAGANAAADQTAERLHAVNQEVEVLQSGVLNRARAAPKPGALTAFLQRVANLAIRYDLRIVQVLPQPARQVGGYLLSDVCFSGRGRSLALARLLDQLACENPHFSLQSFSIKGSPDPADPECELSWTLRLHMLQDETCQRDPAGAPDNVPAGPPTAPHAGGQP